MLRGIHVAGGGIVNPTQIPAGVGHWEWLDSTDRDVAEASGFGSSFEDITNARAAGAFSLNADRQDVPSVVWYPDPRYFNPQDQPSGPGHWAFLTTGRDGHSDQGFARLNLGGTSGMSNDPTASQIFRLRQQYRAQGREDLTAEMRIVWIPGEDGSDSEGDDPVLQPLSPDEEDSLFVPPDGPGAEQVEAPQRPQHGVLGPGILPSDFDPTNGNPGGKTDQTARLCKPRYYTFRIAGRVITLDRAVPQVGKVEEHKTYVFTEEGWRQHTGHVELDWTSQKVLSALTRWREQAARRNGWPQIRPAPRVVYADDEKAWIKEQVHRDLDAGRPYDIPATNLGFQKLFGIRRKRTEVAIGSIMLRIKKEWEKAEPASALMSGLLDEEDEEDDQYGEGEEASEGEGGEEHDGEEAVEGEEDTEMYDETAALATEMEALKRENAAEDEALANLEEERSRLEQKRKEAEQQDGGEHSNFEDDIE